MSTANAARWPWRMMLMLLVPACAGAAPLQIERLTLATGARAAQPSVAADRDGGFVVTWQERIGTATALRFALLADDGRELRRGTVAEGEGWFVNGADFPNLAVLDNGDWVTFWLQKSSPATYAYDILSVRSRDRGARWEPPVPLHRDGTATEHGFVSLIADGDDRVRAVWLDGRRMAAAAGDAADHDHATAEHMTLRSALLGRDGELRDEHELDDLTCACCQTDAVRAGGQTIVVYRDRDHDELRDPYRVSWRDGRWSVPQPLHADGWTIAACPVNGPAIAAQGSRVAMTWPTMADGPMRVMLQIDGTTRPLAEADGELGRVDLTDWVDGQWLASRVRSDERVPTLQLSLLDAGGRILDEQRIATRVGGYPRLARSGDTALLVWTEAGAAAGESTIGLGRIAPTTTPTP